MFYIPFFILKISYSQIPSFLMSDVRESLRSLTKNERCEQIAQDAHQKWATMSDSLRSLTKNEQMSESLVFLANRSFSHFFAKNERFAQKIDESEFPALPVIKQPTTKRPITKHLITKNPNH